MKSDKEIVTAQPNKESDASWFVLYVRSGSEEKVLRLLKKNIDTDTYVPFIPTKVLPQRGKRARVTGEKSKKEYCFPGYIFFRTAKTSTSLSGFFDNVVHKATNIDGAFFFLHYGDNQSDIEMRESERLMLVRLMNADFCIEASVGFKVGDKIRVKLGALVGLESFIKQVNKHKRTCECEFAFMGEDRKFTLMLELLEKA